jgi:hypothetical protein
MSPITWGILKRLSTNGDSNIITSTIKNISTGDVTRGVAEVNIMVFLGLFQILMQK